MPPKHEVGSSNLPSRATVCEPIERASRWNAARRECRVPPHMTLDQARVLVVDGINRAASHETDFSLHDSDKNRLFGSDHYKSDRPVCDPSPWAEGDFEEKMAMLLVWANMLNRSAAAFSEAQRLLEGEDSVIGRVIRAAKHRKASDIAPGTSFSRS